MNGSWEVPEKFSLGGWEWKRGTEGRRGEVSLWAWGLGLPLPSAVFLRVPWVLSGLGEVFELTSKAEGPRRVVGASKKVLKGEQRSCGGLERGFAQC